MDVDVDEMGIDLKCMNGGIRGEHTQLKHDKVHNIFIKVSYSASLSTERPVGKS